MTGVSWSDAGIRALQRVQEIELRIEQHIHGRRESDYRDTGRV